MLPFWCCLRYVIDFQSVVQGPLGALERVPGGPKHSEIPLPEREHIKIIVDCSFLILIRAIKLLHK